MHSKITRMLCAFWIAAASGIANANTEKIVQLPDKSFAAVGTKSEDANRYKSKETKTQINPITRNDKAPSAIPIRLNSKTQESTNDKNAH